MSTLHGQQQRQTQALATAAGQAAQAGVQSAAQAQVKQMKQVWVMIGCV